MIYEYRCTDCKEITEAWRTIAERMDAPACNKCGGETRKIITTKYAVVDDLQPYFDDNLQAHILSKQHRKRVMRDQGVEEKYGQGWYTSAKKHRKVG